MRQIAKDNFSTSEILSTEYGKTSSKFCSIIGSHLTPAYSSSTDCRAFWKIECLPNGMFCVSEGLAGHYALASTMEPEVWGVLP